MNNKVGFEFNYKSQPMKGAIVVAYSKIGFGKGTGIREFLKRNSIKHKRGRHIEGFSFLESKDCYDVSFERETLTKIMGECIKYNMIFDYVENVSIYVPIYHKIPKKLMDKLLQFGFEAESVNKL